jgi:diguanylate cyclase (GGDEF)-like protein
MPSVTTKPQILIVDDDEQVRKLLREYLQEENDCRDVGSAEDAMSLLRSFQFDLVLSDIQMPGLSGLEMAPRILEHSPDTVVIMISGEQTIDYAIEAMRAGAFDYITKPFDLRQVGASVQRALKHQRLLEEKRRYENHLEEMVRERTVEIEHLAYHDHLTDLANRAFFINKCEDALIACQTNQCKGAMLLVSLDRFKRINDTLGHAAGDELVSAVAARLESSVSRRDMLARFDTDEFALLIPRIEDKHMASEVAATIAQVMKPAFRVADDHEIFLTTSIGIAEFPANGENASELTRNAGAALDLAKQQGGNNYRFYQPEMNAHALSRLGLETNLRRAVEAKEFVTFYQPIVNLMTGQTVGFEALVRWQHPRLGLLGPVDFIELAEDTGLILDIGQLVMNEACVQTRCWHTEGCGKLRIAVNVSARQFRDQTFADRLADVLAGSRLNPRYVELEITETTIIDNFESAIALLTDLRRMGIKISIDDFGTGYSSLSYLKHLPVDTVKLDRSFVIGTTTDSRDAALVMAVITLAHSLGLRVIAEGIETESQHNFLRLLSCDEGQGFLLGKPAPAEAIDWSSLSPKRKPNRLVNSRTEKKFPHAINQ